MWVCRVSPLIIYSYFSCFFFPLFVPFFPLHIPLNYLCGWVLFVILYPSLDLLLFPFSLPFLSGCYFLFSVPSSTFSYFSTSLSFSSFNWVHHFYFLILLILPSSFSHSFSSVGVSYFLSSIPHSLYSSPPPPPPWASCYLHCTKPGERAGRKICK